MLGPLNIVLKDFGVSSRNGFLPDKLPLLRLLNPYFEAWEEIVDRLPFLLKNNHIRNEVDKLSILSVSKLTSERELQRAYLLLSLMTQAYIWGGAKPSQRLPASISIPFIAVSDLLGLPPVATASALNSWNFTSCGPDLTKLENLSCCHTLTGTRDEEWFYLVTVAIEARGAEIIRAMLKAMDAVRANDPETVSQCLLEFADGVQEIGVILERTNEECDPDVFYHQIRPLLAGSKNMSTAGLPNGVFYDEGDGKGQWRQYSGGSNAQSSLIQFLDVVLGVEHFHTKSPNAPAVNPAAKGGFLLEMRKYMPAGHRHFLEHIETVANIREYVQKSASGEEVAAAYNLAVSRLGSLRDIHLRIVARYIIGPSRKPTNAATAGLNLAVASTKQKSLEGLPGTGGTELMPFLKQVRDETKDTALS